MERTPLLPHIRNNPFQFTGPVTHTEFTTPALKVPTLHCQTDNWKGEMVEDKISGPRKQGLSKRGRKEDSFELVILEVQGRKISIFSLSGIS